MVNRDLLEGFKKKITEKFDVYRAGANKNVFDLHKREGPDESVTGLRNILRPLHIGPGFYGLYVLTATRQFWGIRKPVLDELHRQYADNWAVVLLDKQPSVGYSYSAADIENSLSRWSTNFSAEDLKVTIHNLGYYKAFTTFGEL